MTSVEKEIAAIFDKAGSGSGKEKTTRLLNTMGDCSILDVDVRNPFRLLDGQTLCEILVRLPVKSLLQAKRVCRHWRSVVRDPYFVGLHFTQSKASPKLLIYVDRSIGRFLFSVDLLEGGLLLDQMKLELQFERDPVLILNPVNGLVCFVRFMGKVLIYNPSTGDKTSWIESKVWEEKKRRNRPVYGFGFDSKTKKHKVVCLWRSLDAGYETGVNDVCEVLTVGQNTWRKIEDIPTYKAYGESVYTNGVIYWLSTYNYFGSSSSADAKFIIAFDIGREKFRVIPIPDFISDSRQSSLIKDHRHDLLVIDGCVGLLDRRLIVDEDGKNVIKVWIFHDDHREKTFTASNWTEEMISIPLEWEKEWIKCYRTIPCSELLFQAITGTDLIIMKPQQYAQLGGVFSLYCYDRKKKTLNLVGISTVNNGKGFLINEAVYGYENETFVESLYPVQQ